MASRRSARNSRPKSTRRPCAAIRTMSSKCPSWESRRRAPATRIRSRRGLPDVDALIEHQHAAIAHRLERGDVAAIEPSLRHVARDAARASCISVCAPGRSRAADSTSAARLLMLSSVTADPDEISVAASPARAAADMPALAPAFNQIDRYGCHCARPRIEHQHADTAGRPEYPNRHLWTPMRRDVERAAGGTAERTERQQRRVADAQRIVAGRDRGADPTTSVIAWLMRSEMSRA